MGKQKNIPALRFPGFEGEWEIKKLGDVALNISSGKSKSRKDIGKYFLYGSTGIIGYSDEFEYSGKNILVARVGANAGSSYKVEGNYSVTDNTLIIYLSEHSNSDFIHYCVVRFNLNKLVFGSGQPLITGGQLNAVNLRFPDSSEQNKIATFLTAIDDRLQALKKKKALLEQYKKGIMQKIFSQELRFKDDNGKEFPDWEEKRLGDCLDYTQPTKYLVSSTEYDDSYRTPVLTAGKTFILGYTNETDGIFEDNLPVIIFDDFTTATQFVDFSFKAKSSAMKILVANQGINIKFIYEAMQMMNYEVGGHERHWISKFAPMYISIPSTGEQTKIANFLSAIDDKTNLCQTQIEKAEKHKKGLLQKMFC